jgi:hypothetical protein
MSIALIALPKSAALERADIAAAASPTAFARLTTFCAVVATLLPFTAIIYPFWYNI